MTTELDAAVEAERQLGQRCWVAHHEAAHAVAVAHFGFEQDTIRIASDGQSGCCCYQHDQPMWRRRSAHAVVWLAGYTGEQMLVGSYASYDLRDADAIREAWPNLPPDLADAWRLLLSDAGAFERRASDAASLLSHNESRWMRLAARLTTMPGSLMAGDEVTRVLTDADVVAGEPL